MKIKTPGFNLRKIKNIGNQLQQTVTILINDISIHILFFLT